MTIPIDKTQVLKKSIGQDKSDAIRYHQKGTGLKQARASNIDNFLIEKLQSLSPKRHAQIENIFYGIRSTLPNDDRLLRINRLINIIRCIPLINTREVSLMLNVGDRQARKYVKIIKVAYPFIVKVMK